MKRSVRFNSAFVGKKPQLHHQARRGARALTRPDGAVPKAFERAIEVNQLKLAALATDAEKSEMYGLFKQAKLGDRGEA